MNNANWQELDMDEYRRLIAECKDDKEFRRRLKEMKPKAAVIEQEGRDPS